MKFLFAFILFVATANEIHADGGTVQISQKSGPFRVTIFTTSAVVRAGPEDVSVLVQDPTTHQPILNAAVQLSFRRLGSQPVAEGEAWVPPCCKMKSEGSLEGMAATHELATNKLLYAALPTFPTAGTWEVHADIQTSIGAASVTGPLQVEPPAPPALAYWPFFLLPVVSIAGYIVHFNLRKK